MERGHGQELKVGGSTRVDEIEAQTPGRSTLTQSLDQVPSSSSDTASPENGLGSLPRLQLGGSLVNSSKSSTPDGSTGNSSLPRLQLGGGKSLPETQRSRFEGSLGTDLSGVRVHTDPAAGEVAASMGARAFAVGQDVVFGKGEYKPGTPGGDKLLAHEVAHTVQQSGSSANGNLQTTQPGDSVERNADSAADAMVAGQSAEVSSSPVVIARKGVDEEVAPEPAGGGAREGGQGGETKEGESEEGGELSAERVGQEEEEGTEPISDLSNEAGKADLQSTGAALPDQGGAEELAGGAPEVPAANGGGGDDQVQLSPELQATLADAQADSKAATDEAKADAEAFQAETAARRERFEAEQNALTHEQLKSMSPADKRATLVEMGYDQKSVKKMKDAELDGIISGRIETEQRKTKILGMSPEELRALSPGAKAQFLVDLGIDKKDVDKIGPQAAARAFDDIMRVAHVPGQHKVKVKVKGGLLGKSWEVSIKVDAEGNPEIEAKKKGGFLSKLWGWVKMALPIIAVVLAPMTAGASLIVLAVYQTVTAIANGDWLGAIVGAAGALVGLGAIKGIASSASGAAKAFTKIADVAGKVQKVAQAAQAAMVAAKAKNAGGLLAALSAGAGAFAGFAAKGAEKFAATMRKWADKLDKWSKIISGGEKVVKGVKTGNFGTALAGAFESASAGLSKKDANGKETNSTAADLSRYARMASFVAAGQNAAKQDPPGLGQIIDAAMGIAGELKLIKKDGDAAKITAAATKLGIAIASKDPAQISAAALGLAESIQVAKINADDEKSEGTGKEADKAKVAETYARANRVVKVAIQAIQAASKKPRPDYASALDAAAQLVAEFTEDKRLDAAARVTSAMDAWTKAIGSKNEAAILKAGMAFGEAINGLRTEINDAKEKSKAEAEAALAPGQTLPEADAGAVPTYEGGPAPTTTPEGETGTESAEPVASVEMSEEFRYNIGPRAATPGANYTVIPGDTLSGIASRFNTTVAILRAQNPQLVQDTIYQGQRIFVPGADVVLTPSVTVTEDYRVPGTQPAPGQPPSPGSTPPIPAEILTIMDLIDKFAAMGEWPDEFRSFLGVAQSAAKALNGLYREGKTDSAEYKKYLAVLEAAAKGTQFADAIVKKIAGYQGSIKDLLDVDANEYPIRLITAYAQLGKFLVRVGKIGGSVLDGVDAFVTVAGYKPDGSGRATMFERITAAQKLVSGASGLAPELSWMYSLAREVAPRLTGSIEGALVAVRSAASSAFSRIGGARAADAMSSFITRGLQTAAQRVGSTKAAELGMRLAGIITEWGSTQLARVTAKEGLMEVMKALAPRLGIAAESALSVPVALAIEYFRFEYYLLTEVYPQALDAFSAWLSERLFGVNVVVLKQRIRGQSMAGDDAQRSTIRNLYGIFDGAHYDVRSKWKSAIAAGLRKRSGIAFLASDAEQSEEALLARLQQYIVYQEGVPPMAMHLFETASALRDTAIEYANAEYKRVFNRDAPG